MTHDTSPEHGRPPARLTVARGGVPTPEELAALTAVLAATSVAPSPPEHEEPAAWLRAALREATGGPRVAAPADLDVPRP